MKHHLKFENLEEELFNLQDIFKNSLQNEVLAIKRLDKTCEKFKHISDKTSNIYDAEHVIFSKFMCKEFHNLETFVFVNTTGELVCNMSGRDIELYNMLKECDNLIETPEYD